jgi:hypothetical protein
MVLRSAAVVNPCWRWNRMSVGKRVMRLWRPAPIRSVKRVAAVADAVAAVAICTDSRDAGYGWWWRKGGVGKREEEEEEAAVATGEWGLQMTKARS